MDDDFDLSEQPHLRRDSIDETPLTHDVAHYAEPFEQKFEQSVCTETREMRLVRLKREMDELFEEGQDYELQQKWETLQRGVKRRVDVNMEELSIRDDGTSVLDISVLEAKVASLEKSIGSTGTSIQSQINKIQRTLQLLQPETLQHLSQSIDMINEQFTQSIALRRSVALDVPVKGDAKIHELYQTLQILKPMCDELPFLLKRLETLNGLHRSLFGANKLIGEMDARMDAMESDFNRWDDILTKLESNVQ